MTDTVRNQLPQMGPGTSDHDGIYTEMVNRLDALLQASVIGRDLTAPPGGESNGDRWLVAAGATGDWAGHDDEIALWYDGWLFFAGRNGWRLWVEDEQVWLGHDGADWFVVGAPVQITISGSGAMTAAQARERGTQVLIADTDGPVAPFTWDFPDATPRRLVVVNLTDETATVRAAGGGGVTLAIAGADSDAAGWAQDLVYDGTDVRPVAPAVAWV